MLHEANHAPPRVPPPLPRRYHWQEWTKRVHPPPPQPYSERISPDLRPGGKPTRIDLHYKASSCRCPAAWMH